MNSTLFFVSAHSPRTVPTYRAIWRSTMLGSNDGPDPTTMSKTELDPFERPLEDAVAKGDVRRRKEAIAAVRRAVEELGFSLEEILNFQPEEELRRAFRRRPRPSVTFRNPENPQEIWSGRGRRPTWLIRQLEAGKRQDDLRV